MSLAPGSQLGPYEIVGILGQGGMGVVYRARDPRLGREVAIKTMHARLADDTMARTRFERESRAVAALSHPNVVAIHDVGDEGGIAFAVTELLEGETLRERLERGPLPWPEAVALATAIAEGLGAAHARGIVHRDVKPANVFLARDGRVKVLDFGLALDGRPLGPVGEDTPTASEQTRPGSLVGTVNYMSPEQARGGLVDARSDVFGLGCVVHEMLTGRGVFRRPTAVESLAAVLGEEAAALPPSVPAGLARAVQRCLEKDPKSRFATAAELAFELRAVASGEVQSSPDDREPGAVDSLAVLPFLDLSPEKDQEYFCDGLAEEMINALTRIRGLRVASRTSSFQFKGAAVDVRDVGRRLGVRAVLEGSVRKSGERLRVTVQITDVAQGFSLSSERYDGALQDVFEVQEDIARRVVQALEIRLSERERQILKKPPTSHVHAYDLYLRARGLFNQLHLDALHQSREMFEAAIALDPAFAQAHAGLADVCSWLYQWRGRRPEHLAAGLLSSARALELRPDLAEAHSARGLALALSGDTAGAERAYRTAIELNPRLYDPHYSYGRTLLEQGRLVDAARLFERAAELQPEDYQSVSLLAMIFSGLGEAERARAYGERAVAKAMQHLERHPQDVRATYLAGLDMIRLGEVERGLEWVERARRLDPDDGGTLYNVACAYALAHRPEQAFEVLELALDRQVTNRPWIENDSDWDALKDHPRFRALLDRLR